ncbi:jg6094 [Pararge aegeria aegeria]|uniref:Jg6094 protein n=1 Tax=Pararge aegeria aegeria TaxID=348720 RepID=A0A8S4S896_9NEOP|nr:jg6094 [Pararge aegeria aegeria]
MEYQPHKDATAHGVSLFCGRTGKEEQDCKVPEYTHQSICGKKPINKQHCVGAGDYVVWKQCTAIDKMRRKRLRGVTDSPLCRACMEKNETPTHVMLECTGVTEQREIWDHQPLSHKSSATWAACWNSGTSLDGWSSEQQWEISRTTSEALTCGNCPEEEQEEVPVITSASTIFKPEYSSGALRLIRTDLMFIF